MDMKAATSAPTFPGFSLAERDRRWKLARDLMDEQGVDALLVAGERNMDLGTPLLAPDNYLTNDRPGALVILPREGAPVALVWAAQVVAAHAQGELRGEGSWVPAANMYVGRSPERLGQVMKMLGLEKGRVGVVGIEPGGPGGESFISQYAWEGIKQALPNATFKPVWVPFAAMMSVKSAEEIAVLRQAADAGERMCEALLEMARPGINEAQLYSAALSASFDAGAISSWMIMQTGPENTCWGPPNWLFRPIKPRTVVDGDLILTELFPAYGLIEVQQQMAIAVGKVHPTVEKCAAVARESYEAGLAACKPGRTFGELADAMVKPVKAVNGWYMTPQIHSLNPITLMVSTAAYGVQNMVNSHLYPPIATRPERDKDTILLPGMTFAFETNCHLEHRRVNIGGTVLVTENGAEELNTLCNHMQRV